MRFGTPDTLPLNPPFQDPSHLGEPIRLDNEEELLSTFTAEQVVQLYELYKETTKPTAEEEEEGQEKS